MILLVLPAIIGVLGLAFIGIGNAVHEMWGGRD